MRHPAVSILAGLFLLTGMVCPAQAKPAGEDDLFSAFGEQVNSDSHFLNAKSSNSADFDNWIKHYLAGKDSEADSDWCKVAKTISKPDDLHSLMKKAIVRITFSEGDNPRRSPAKAVISMMTSSEKALGQGNVLLCSGYSYASGTCKNTGAMDAAITYKRKQVNLEEKFFPCDKRQCYTRLDFANLLFGCHQIDEAVSVTTHMQPMVVKIGDAKLEGDHHSLVVKLKEARSKK
jgi:hypothetical protein